MPRGHGRTVFNADNVAERRSSALSRRFSEQSSRKLSSKENLVVVPVLRNCEESRFLVLRFPTLDHWSRMPVPFNSFIRVPELRNEQDSQNPVNADMLDSHNSSFPQPTIFIQFDLQDKQTPCSQETVTDYRSSLSNVLGEPRRVTRNKSIKNNLNNSLPAAAPKDSSWLNYGSDCIALNVPADAIGKVDKPAKQSSRKKGKKKGKQYKRSMNKKVSVKLENQSEEVNCDASKSETSHCGDLVSSFASENNLSLAVACPSLLVQDNSNEVLEQLECNDKDCSGISSSSVGKRLDKSIDGSRKQVSLPSEFTDDDDDADNMSFEVVTSGSNQSCELSLSTSLQNNPEIDMAEDSLDNRMNFTSRNGSAEGECREYSHQDNGLSSSGSANGSDWQKYVADTDYCSERLLGSSQASSSDDFHPVIRNKRGRLARKFSGHSNEAHGLNNVHLHRCYETNSKNSIWKKVEKASTSELARPGKDEKFSLRNVDISLYCVEAMVRQPSELKQGRNGKSFRFSNETNSSKSYSSVVSSIVDTNSGHVSMDSSAKMEKLRRKPNVASEQESQCARHASVNNINIPTKTQVLRNENFGAAVEFTNNSQLSDRIDASLRSTKNSQSSILQKATRPDNICNILQNTSSMCQEIPANSSVIESSSDQIHADTQFHGTKQPSVDTNNDPCICTSKEDIQCNRIHEESACLESSRTDNSSGSLIQKSISNGRLDLVISRSQMDDQVYSTVHDSIPVSLNSNFTDDFSSNSRSLVCLSSREIQCSGRGSSYMDCSSPEDGELISKLEGQQPCTSSEESIDLPSPSGCHLSPETKGQPYPGFETDLTNIIDAVDGSYKLLVEAEGVRLATGSSLAGFERVLHSASPLIETGCIRMCSTCSQTQINGDSLCFHQVPNTSLRRLWQWYEKPGSYGLEVKLEDLYSSKRSRYGHSKLCAYFVPYLSAVQLFGQSEKSIDHPENDAEAALMKTCDVCDKSKCSTGLASLPIFSKLLPQPCRKEDTRLTKLSSSAKSEEFNKPIFRQQLADELLFEYFDSDQPQQRRPLFDKIQELILGDSSSNCDFFGDPSKLWSLNLKELHPASWYAVAWYPIYRIPDGSFRATFLTYHSFGRFVRRSTSISTDGCINSLILPVVGLQSYNAQGEFWFEPTNMNPRAVQTDSFMPSSPSENLKGRLQSLERTAHVMSRAAIPKANLNCTNRHPDFEFFLSRKR